MATEKEKLDMCSFYLIKIANETNADEMKIEHKNVTVKGEPIGTWEIIVKRKKQNGNKKS